VNDATAPPKAEAPRKELWRRIASALVLMPIAVAADYLGGAYFFALVLAAAILMAWEWAGMGSAGRIDTRGRLLIAAIVGTLLLGWFTKGLALGLAALGCIGLYFCAAGARGRWLAGGLAYVAIATLSLLALREPEAIGALTILWLFVVVWGTDVAAYFTGRALGGPKLAPRISPGKTWSGLAGGATAAVAGGAIFAALVGASAVWVALISLGLALASQAGDLFESWVKRQHGVKDSGRLIPGHGGVLDRVDGLVAGAVALEFIELVAGRPVLEWSSL
jgi:phosphatidate cytidylyltransferase